MLHHMSVFSALGYKGVFAPVLHKNLHLRVLMQRQMTSEVQANRIPSVTVGLVEVLRR